MQLSCPTRHYNSQLKNMCKLNNLFWFYYKDIKSRALVQCLQGPYDLSCESQRMLNIRKKWYRDTSLCEANLQLRYSTLSNPQDLFSTVVRWKKCILKTLFSLLILKYFQIFYLNLQNSISKATKETLKNLQWVILHLIRLLITFQIGTWMSILTVNWPIVSWPLRGSMYLQDFSDKNMQLSEA